MAEYGMIYNANDIKKQLYESNRGYNQRKTWEGMYLSSDIAGQQLQAGVTGAYSGAIGQAYASSTAGKSAIAGSNLGQGFKSQLMQENDLALQQAYDAYSQNIAQARQEIDYSLAENAQAIDTAAQTQAEYIKDYAVSHFDYLENLYAGYESGENTLFDSAQWSKYLKDVVDEEGNPTGEKRLMTRDELMSPSFVETEGKGKEYTSLYDEQGNLTMKGVDFFDQMQNQNITSNTFGSFLASERREGETEAEAKRRQELLAWSQSYNPYDYTFAGTQKGSFRTMVGMASMDNAYSFAERMGGFTSTEIDNLYSGFNTAATELESAMKSARDKGGEKSISGKVSNLVKEIEKLTVDLGIDDQFDFDKLNAEAEAYLKGTKTGGQMTGDFFKTVAGKTVERGVQGFSVGMVLPGIGAGTVAVASAIGGLLEGIIEASIATSKQKDLNKQMAEKSKMLYMNLLNNLINYSKAQQKQSQLDFNKQMNRF